MREGGGYCNLVGRTNDAAEHPTITKNYPAHSVSGAKVEKPGYLLLLFLVFIIIANQFHFLLHYQKSSFLDRGFQTDIV